MKNARDYIPVVAACDLPVMIYGETGTGKEVFAQSIHNASERRDKPFIAQNCAALPDTLLESILFGTSRGAFTGAMENKKGLFELADGGTLFLDGSTRCLCFCSQSFCGFCRTAVSAAWAAVRQKRTRCEDHCGDQCGTA